MQRPENIAHLRVWFTTLFTGLALVFLSILTFHYYLSANLTAARESMLRRDMAKVIENLAEVESSLSRLELRRSQMEGVSRLAFDEILRNTGLSTLRASALHTGAGEPQGLMLSHLSGQPAGQEDTDDSFSTNTVIERLADARRRADVLSAEIKGTGGHLQIRQEIRAAIPSVLPAAGRISSEFGERTSPFHEGRTAMHNGIDIAADPGTPVIATADGVVIFAGDFGGYGKFVKIDHGFGITTRYAHNAGFLVKKGDAVKRGQQIAAIGLTGRTTGPHLHYEVQVYDQPVDPRRFFFDAAPMQLAQSVATDQPLAVGGDAEDPPALSNPQGDAVVTPTAGTLSEKPAPFWSAAELSSTAQILPLGLFGDHPTRNLLVATIVSLLLAVTIAVLRLPEGDEVDRMIARYQRQARRQVT